MKSVKRVVLSMSVYLHKLIKFFTSHQHLFKWQIAVLSLGFFAIILHGLFWLWWPTWAHLPLLAVIGICALPLMWQIGHKLLKKDLGADILAAISIIAALILGQYLACVLIILMLISGQTLESFAKQKASSVLAALARRMPSIAHKKTGSLIEDIDPKNIKIDDLIVLWPHEPSPVDGLVVEGHGHMDESYLTGEPYQIAKAPGSKVFSGAINNESMMVIKATRLAQDSRYAEIIKVIAEAEQKRPSIRRLADQLGAIFGPIALAFAILVWIYTGDPVRFLSVLVIATPCPLLIAIPIALIAAISLAARKGIIISDPVVLERLSLCKTAIFDKTGTLTLGRPELTHITVAPGFLRNDILKMVASLERYSKHPLASAILQKAKEERIVLMDALRIQEKPGVGLMGQIEDASITITNRQKILSLRPDLSASLPPHDRGLECIVLVNEHYAACLRFKDEIREDSKNFISHLRPFHSFQKIMMISGDRPEEVEYLAQELGIKDSRSLQSPEEKLAIVQAESQKAPTLFLGDGINDAPALKAATVGIAFGQFAFVTSKAAGAVIMENRLLKVDELLHLSKNTRKIALIAGVGGMGLSVIGMGFAAYGLISPALGALVQQGIDAWAILYALRLTWQREIKIDLPA